MFKKLLLVLVLIVIALAVYIALQPEDFKVTRSAKIAAPAQVVFDQVNDFHKWDAWSPWAKLDPNAKNSFEGPAAGVGAIFRWDGNNDVGQGSMTITESKPAQLIRLKLQFIRPMPGDCEVGFTFTPEGDNTAVSWSMEGKNNFIGKAFSLVMDCDKMVGDMYEKGLSSMKTVAEAAAKK